MSIAQEIFSLGSRLAFDGALCTVRYVGTIEGTAGLWLGVEWDDPTRGKHAGEHKGVKYFDCKRKHPCAGSFVRPGRTADKPLSFLEAAHMKYVSDTPSLVAGNAAPRPIVFSGKVVEEVGFEKIRKLLSDLKELRIVLLDGMCVRGVLADHDATLAERQLELENVKKTCPKITELDLSRNLLEDWSEITDICLQLGDLKRLKLNGNRFKTVKESRLLTGISELSLNETLLSWEESVEISNLFPSLTSISLLSNQLSSISIPITHTIKELALGSNEFGFLDSLRALTSLPNLSRLSLRGNKIHRVYSTLDSNVDEEADSSLVFSRNLTTVDLSQNNIDSWGVINALLHVFPGLSVLRISDNPLFNQAPAPSAVTNTPESPMTVDEAFMLTLARLGQLKVLNFSKISPQERANGELYYLGLIRTELALYPSSAEGRILNAHPRYRELCDMYELSDIKRKISADDEPNFSPRSLGARLVMFTFHLSSPQTNADVREFRKEIPRSFDIYRIKAIVSREFNLTPLKFRLIWETDEWDPVEQGTAEEDEWDSEEEWEGGTPALSGMENIYSEEDRKFFARREEELVDSTKEVGLWLSDEIRTVRVRVEPS